MNCDTSKCMQQEFQLKLRGDFSKMSRNKSFDFRARFGAIYSASKTKKYFLKNSTIGNRVFKFVLRIRKHWNYFSRPFELVAGSTSEQISFWCLRTISQLNFEGLSSSGLLLQRFFWKFSGIFIISIKTDIRNFSTKISVNLFTRRGFFRKVGSF